MATFKVIGKGQDKKYFDDMALNDVISYITQPQKKRLFVVYSG